MSSYWNKRELNQLLPQYNKGHKGHFECFELVFFIIAIRDLNNYVPYYTKVEQIEAALLLSVM